MGALTYGLASPHLRSLTQVQAGAYSCQELNNSFYFSENPMALGTILLIVLVLLLVGAVPAWPHSRSWGYGPSGGLGLVVLILLVLLLMGKI